jgi:two-component system, cell cycle response regulator DivK
MPDRKRLLIVEDTADLRDMYEHFLSRQGYAVASAGDGQEAITKALGFKPDLIIMDLMLPVMDGREAIRRLKQNAQTRNIPVIVLTALTSGGSAAVIQEGCEGFVMKPATPKDLHSEILRVLHRVRP